MLEQILQMKELGGTVLVGCCACFFGYKAFCILLDKIIEPLANRHKTFLDKLEVTLDRFAQTLDSLEKGHGELKNRVDTISNKLDSVIREKLNRE